MTEDELMIPGTEEEDEAMLPDGWKEGDDFFADPSTWSGNAKAPDEAPVTPDEAESTEPAPESEEAPTTGKTEVRRSKRRARDRRACVRPDGGAC